MAKEPKLVKCIVVKGQSFYDNNRDPKLCMRHEEGDVVTVDLNAMKLGENLRELTPAELKMTAKQLRTREVGEEDQPIEEVPVSQAA